VPGDRRFRGYPESTDQFLASTLVNYLKALLSLEGLSVTEGTLRWTLVRNHAARALMRVAGDDYRWVPHIQALFDRQTKLWRAPSAWLNICGRRL
jgi:hypothetical protein